MRDFRKLRKWHSYNVLSSSISTGSLEKWYNYPYWVLADRPQKRIRDEIGKHGSA